MLIDAFHKFCKRNDMQVRKNATQLKQVPVT